MNRTRVTLTAATAAAALLALAALPMRTDAQLTITSDAGLASGYVWRGITATNRPVLQPDLLAALSSGSYELLVGAWANLEPARYDAPGQISQGGGTHGGDLTEADVWLELTRRGAAGSFTVGGLQYFFPNAAGITSSSNTFEAYAKAALALPLAPRVAVYQDLDRVRGTYLEAALGQGVPLWGTPVTLGALVGYSVGEHADSTSTDVWYYERDGVTHVDLSASTAWSAGAMVIVPNVHLFLARDPVTKITAPDRLHGSKIRVGATLTWARTFGGREQ